MIININNKILFNNEFKYAIRVISDYLPIKDISHLLLTCKDIKKILLDYWIEMWSIPVELELKNRYEQISNFISNKEESIIASNLSLPKLKHYYEELYKKQKTDFLKFSQRIKKIIEKLQFPKSEVKFNIEEWMQDPVNQQALLNVKICNLKLLWMTFLPKEIFLLSNLTELDLSNNKLIDISFEVSKLVNLQNLYLSFNRLSNFPKGICELKKLKRLSVAFNQLINIPEEIYKLRVLKRLYLHFNKLIKLPKEICELSSLKRLYLSDNQLEKFPEGIENLKELKRLYLHNNRLTTIPETHNLINLQQLTMHSQRNFF